MKVAIVVPITRRWAIPIVASNLQRLDYGGHEISVWFYIDSNDESLAKDLMDHIYLYRPHLMLSNNQPTMERKVAYRRNRIVDVKKKTAQWIEPVDYVFSFEDDTVLPANALTRLMDILTVKKFGGFVQGIQCGRWDLPMLGAWRVDDPYSPTKIETLPLLKGVHRVDAGGFYCYLTTYELYTTIPYYWHDECFGPDVCFGLEVRKKALPCYTDFDLICGHAQENGTVLFPTGNEKNLVWYERDGQWIRDFSYFDLQKGVKNDAK